jgi:ATP-dependent DNA helicase RecG
MIDAPVDTLRGVGPSLKDKLERLHVYSTTDLLLHLPRRYQDRSRVVPLRELEAEQECLVEGIIVDARLAYGRRRSLVITVEDSTGYLKLRFFHFARSQQQSLKPGVQLRCFGQVRLGREGFEMAHPEYRVYAGPPAAPDSGLTPVYPTTKGLGQARLRSLVAQVLKALPEVDPDSSLARLKRLHEPGPELSAADLEADQEALARDELTAYYLVMRRRQAQRARQGTRPLPSAQQLGRQLLKRLGFRLTGAQRRVLTEVLEDLAKGEPMLRLIQGDVGSGKTVIAAFAAIRASEHGAQTALMAPTEILAEQHYLNFLEWLAPLGIEVVHLTGSQSAAQRREALHAIESGRALVAVGTHALFQRQVSFPALALTIVDEQHRFGVHQRMALRAKGLLPHQLVMTATPIPRTLTMTLYADMDVSVIDELPKGRQPIDTLVLSAERREEVIERLRERLEEGEQAYWVCPLIEESEQLNAVALETLAPELEAALPDAVVGMLHGRMASAEKAAVMGRFKSGELDVLAATTVVEVGVDVPNATLMVIENPERMGLSQLHQLRGRVGRGPRRSRCILLYGSGVSEQGRTRLKVMRESQDGFYIAEQDLALRGPGDLLGTRQTGEQQFRVADLSRHAHLIPEIVSSGDALLADRPEEAARLLELWAPGETGPISV